MSFVATSTFALDVPDVLISSIGMVIFLIFASQEDVLVAWRIKHPKSHVENYPGNNAEGLDDQSAHEEGPPLSRMSLFRTSHGPSRASSILELPASSGNKRDLANIDQTERSPTSFGDIESVGTTSSPYHSQ